MQNVDCGNDKCGCYLCCASGLCELVVGVGCGCVGVAPKNRIECAWEGRRPLIFHDDAEEEACLPCPLLISFL